ncbi:MAG TPA: argininosuccinate lyase [Bacteroidales bacterium]|nr:argininosuccinate lyase [Bacteroidales bacterium]
MKLWEKGISPDPAIIEFTSGKDRDTDLEIAGWDIVGSMAHVIMLAEVKLISQEEKHDLLTTLHSLFLKAAAGEIVIEKEVEDIHSQIEKELTVALGPAGKKVHTARSRNDQILLDLRLFTRAETDRLAVKIFNLFTKMQALSEQFREFLIPGYTHMQPAMVSSFGLWFGGYAEALADDLYILSGVRKLNNRCPLGTAAGYGTTLPVNRKLTAELLDFDDIIFNSSYASLNRGKVEMAIGGAIASLGNTLSRFAMDICLFMSAELKFVEFPDEFVTGSSIMPQKRNPDVFEIIRARSNSLQTLPNHISMITNNLPSGYNRDMQLLKSLVFDAFREMGEMLDILVFMLGGIKVRRNITEDPIYNSIFSTEEVNRLVRSGIPFRDAYKAVAGMVKNGTFSRTQPSDYSHDGSIGNLCNDQIRKRAEKVMKTFRNTPIEELEVKLMKHL